MQVLPEDMRPVDTERPSAGLETVTQYIHYMRDRIEFANSHQKKGEGGIEEAPVDGSTYGRKDGGWTEITGGGGGGTDDYNSLTNRPRINGTILVGGENRNLQTPIADLTAIRNGASLGATSVQPGNNVSTLNNDAGYITSDVKIKITYPVVNASETLVFAYTTEPIE